MSQYKEDCIHLHACRRLSKIAQQETGKRIARGCNEQCTAYISGDYGKYITVNEAVEYAIHGSDSILDGYDPYDVYASQDLSGKSIREIIEECENN